MWRSTWRSLLAHKLRLAFSGLAIVLGVASSADDDLHRHAEPHLHALFASSAADVSVRPAAAFDESMSGQSGTTPACPRRSSTRSAPSTGSPRPRATCRPKACTCWTGPGTSWTPVAPRGRGQLVRRAGPVPERATDGRARRAAVRWRWTAPRRGGGYAVGDRVTVLTPGPRVDAEVVGIFSFGEGAGWRRLADRVRPGDRPVAPGAGDEVTAIDVLAATGSPTTSSRTGIAAAVGRYDVTTAQSRPTSRQPPWRTGCRSSPCC
jgi:putative ABC transport system permease protein